MVKGMTIIVAYGTNDWNCCEREEIRNNILEFLNNVTINYPNSKIFVIFPIWRKDYEENKKAGTFWSAPCQVDR